MASLDLGNGIVVEGTEGHLVRRNSGRRRRGSTSPIETDEVNAALGEALLAADFEIAGDTLIEPQPRPRRGRRGDETVESPSLKVSVKPDETAVLLIENDEGVLQWQYPDDGKEAAPSRRRSADATLTFTLGDEGEEEEGAGRRVRRRRSYGGAIRWVGRKLAGRIRVRILRFVAEKAVDKLVDHIEGDTPTGMVVMGEDPQDWLPSDTLPDLPEGRAPYILLFVHGTFSTTLGSFGGLPSHGPGSGFLERAQQRYDAIIGFDHLTLALDPEENAQAILDGLSFLPAGTRIDAVAYSRGGLVLRTLAEKLAPQGRPDLRFEKHIFVGCTNAGTALAEPDNWQSLIDLYTNIAVAGGRALTFLGSPVAGSAVTIAVRLLGRFVQALPSIAIEDARVPGLAAMEPDGKFVAELNQGEGSTNRYFVVASDFEPRIDKAKGLTGGLAQMLADRVVDRLMDQQNDLVVHTGSMTDFGPARSFDDARLHHFDASEAVYHTIYFITPTVAVKLTDWLLGQQQQQQQQQQQVAPPPPPEPEEDAMEEAMDEEAVMEEAAPPPPRRRRGRRGGSGAARDHQRRMASPPPQPAADRAPSSTLPSPTVDCHIAAEMNPTPFLGGVAPLFVTISRKALRVAAHRAAAMTPEAVAARTDVPIEIEVIALENCWVSCDDPDAEVHPEGASASLQIDVPDNSDIVRFTVEGAELGAASLQIEVSQGLVSLASFALSPTFIDPEQDTLSVEKLAKPIQPTKDYPAVMRIYEQSIPGLGLVLKYDLMCIDPPIAEKHEVVLHKDFSIGAFTAEFLQELEDAYDLGSREYDAFLERISDFSAIKTAEIIPQEIRQALWDNRERFHAIQVLAENPYIPWELLYVEDPSGKNPGSGQFLSELGLVRWMYNAKMPGEVIRARGDQTRYVIPEYLNADDRLAAADIERDMIQDMFPGAKPIPADSKSVREFLSQEASECDILHFACHGLAEQRSVLSADLLLTELKETDGRISSDRLTSDTVKRYAKFGEEWPTGLVLVNACQTGRPGLGVAGVSGFADSFLRPSSRCGAAAFIGALWSVDDQLALTFAKTLYRSMRDDGKTLVEASKVARKACQDKYDFTWLAYSVYGNPVGRFETPDDF